MAYVNVKDWSVDQVTDWLKGLDPVIGKYTERFLNNGVTGHQLLNLRGEDLNNLGIESLGHQEIILEAAEHLRHFHYELDKENLQMLAMKVSCASNSVYRELIAIDDKCPVVPTQILSDVHNVIMAIKPLVCWLDQAPFLGDKDYLETKSTLLQHCFTMATTAHRDNFSETPVKSIREICEKISKLADNIIQANSDPMILQPASLDLATLKKKEQELGFFILPHNQSIHQVAEIKYGSPAHGSSKIEEGDEIVQVNYQTVVGWQRKNVMYLLHNSPPDIVLTLKKRPRHTKVYGQIYMKPYRLPSKRRDGNLYSRWNDGIGIPSPRLLPINNFPSINITKVVPKTEPVEVGNESDINSSSDSDGSDPPDSPLDGTGRMYPLKPRPILQRRNTISGSTPTSKRPYPSVEQYLRIWKNEAASTHSSSFNIDNFNFDDGSNFIRDKSASCTLGLELAVRPTTVLGLTHTRNKSFKTEFSDRAIKKRVNFEEKHKQEERRLNPPDKDSNLNEEKSVSVASLASLTNENIAFIDEGRELTDRTSMVTENEDSADRKNASTSPNESNKVKDSVLADIKIHDIIKKFDEQKQDAAVRPKIVPRALPKKPPEIPQKPESSKKPVVPPRSSTSILRGRLDKSYSTPAYDLTDEEPAVIDKIALENEVQDEVTNLAPESKSEIEQSINENRHELGIPIVPVQEEFKDELHTDLPPKPPPRTFGLMDLNKPAYPIDSPKPQILDKSKAEISHPQKNTVFEFPETKHEVAIKPIDSPTICQSTEKLHSKCFEPKTASTPKKVDCNAEEEVLHKLSPSFEVQKSMSDSKISPTNSIVRAMIYSNKTKAGKKKNSITAKRRKVSVNDLNPPDIQGFLYQRLRSKHNQNVHWEKRWFVLLGSCLYGFKTKEDPRAACLIFLSGFTVAVANEVKSRSNAFKVYHTGTVFYFSCEDSETLQTWIEMITVATLNSQTSKVADGSLYSETDESDSEKPKKIEQEKNPEALRKFGSLKKFTSKKGDTAPTGSTSLDRKWFFGKSNSHSKHSLPVPTDQFRSYRKIKVTDDPPKSVTTGNFTSHVPSFAPRSEIPKLQQSGQNISVPNLTVDHLSKTPDKNVSDKLTKMKQLNYIHASNPSLCNVNDFNVPGFPKKTFKQGNESLAGFVTLEELMNKQSEERKLNPYNRNEDVSINFNLIKPDVVYGEVPIRPKEKINVEEKHQPFNKGHIRTASDSQTITDKHDSSSSCFGKRLGSIKKSSKADDGFETKTSTYPKIGRGFDQKLNRSLPRTHRLPESYNKSSRYTSDKNLAFKERSYEMIYCPETTTDVQFAQNRNLDDHMYKDGKKGHKVKKQHSFTSADKKRSYFESSKYSNKVGDSPKVRLKSAIQYTPMSLPLGPDQKSRPKLAFELNLDEKTAKGGKLKHIFGKPNEGRKEKTFLGSPKLHRAFFGKNASGNGLTNWPTTTSAQSLSMTPSAYSSENCLPPESISINLLPHAMDYPGLEYPPVFEAETYSLADPQSSLTLLRKQGKN